MSWLSCLPLGAFFRKGDRVPEFGRRIGDGQDWRGLVESGYGWRCAAATARAPNVCWVDEPAPLTYPTIDPSLIPEREDNAC